jgi:predicted nucleic acid-binding protein
MAPGSRDLRVMVDANVLIAGIVWPRWPYEVLQHGLRGDFRLVLSDYILTQARFHINRRFTKFSEQFKSFLQICNFELVQNPTRLTNFSTWFVIHRMYRLPLLPSLLMWITWSVRIKI